MDRRQGGQLARRSLGKAWGPGRRSPEKRARTRTARRRGPRWRHCAPYHRNFITSLVGRPGQALAADLRKSAQGVDRSVQPISFSLSHCCFRPNIRPSFRFISQFGPHWIHTNIICLFYQRFIIAQAMLKIIPLPCHPKFSSSKMLPIRDCLYDPRGIGKANQSVHMVGHEQDYMRPPAPHIPAIQY